LDLLASLAAPKSLKLAPAGSLSVALLEAVAVVVPAPGQALWETRMLVPLLASVPEKVPVGSPSAALVPALEQVLGETKTLV